MEFDEMIWSLAERAYTAYREDAKGQSYNGRPIPGWDDVKPKIKGHWRQAILAITRPDAPETHPAANGVNEALNRRPEAKTIGEMSAIRPRPRTDA